MLIQRRALIRINTASSFALIGCFDVSDFSLRRLNTSLLTSIIFRDGRYYKPYSLTNTLHPIPHISSYLETVEVQ